MQFVVCTVAVCPLRSEASHRSEMVSALLFGEAAEVLEAGKAFTKIKCLYDDYTGWAQTSQLAETDKEIAKAKPAGYTFTRNTTVEIDGTQLFVSVATPVFANTYFGKHKIEYGDRETLLFDASFFRDEVIKMVALLYDNVPYLWGWKKLVRH